MKHRLSLWSCLIITVVLLAFRVFYSDIGAARKQLILTQWDAFGYYLYLPATAIYHDYKKLNWAEAMDKKYLVSGGGAMPFIALENGNRVSKYLCGVALLQSPFFAVGHLIAKATGRPADGFSAPYQYALGFGLILYSFLALLVLRRVLLCWFSDAAVAIALLLLCLASNFIQYAAVDSGLSHGWIFLLYALLLFTTIQWHQQPRAIWAWLTGFLIGLATICRPTEAIALFIPLLWGLQSKAASKEKWRLVRTHKLHVLYAALGGLLGILPQLLYWKSVTGSFIFDVGSKWVFLNPWWRVLIVWEKGWFIYTPVALLFVAGLFFMKPFPFRKAALVFCLLNIWIVISWDEWQYGASYSTRALMQSYPVFALPLAALVQRIQHTRWNPLFLVLGLYLIGVNLFQTWQYNRGIIHFNDMNRRYYGRIYLNAHPGPLDMSLLDTQEWLQDESNYRKYTLDLLPAPRNIAFPASQSAELAAISLDSLSGKKECWLRLHAHIDAPGKLWQSRLSAELQDGDLLKQTSVRLFNPIGERTGDYAFYMYVPPAFARARLRVFLASDFDFEGRITQLSLTVLER
jgi:hypothetical protein